MVSAAVKVKKVMGLSLRPFCVELSCSPCDCMSSVQVLHLPPKVKNMPARSIGHSGTGDSSGLSSIFQPKTAGIGSS